MMDTLIGLALKSLLIAGVTLGLLWLTRRRSAADRSAIAHLGLLALVALPLASVALPAWSVELPAALSVTTAPAPVAMTVDAAEVAPPASVIEPPRSPAESVDWTRLAYALPAAALLLVTLLALLRLFGLRRRAEVMVDPLWLSALAHAQRRMGFKNGTALLSSAELGSPISWGLMRPVILLNDQALAAPGEAEAIIAHELAHVARLDWAKLMLARVATAIFWFNPLAWVLAREAHQLREEAADDAVLGADIADTDYAQLLVGIARHEHRGLLLGAHGISPGKGSLRRRVSRVLDASLARGSGGRSWIAGFAAGMLVMSAPLAAVSLAPAPLPPVPVRAAPAPAVRTARLTAAAHSAPQAPAAPVAALAPVAPAAPIAPTAAKAPAAPAAPEPPVAPIAPLAGAITTAVTRAVTTSLSSAAEAVRAIDRRGVGRGPGGMSEMEMLGVTPAYAAAIRAAGPQFRSLSDARITDLHVQRVTPQFIRALVGAGYGGESVSAIGNAAMIGLDAEAVRDYAALGGRRRPLAELAELRMMGVTPHFIARVECCGRSLSKDQLIGLRLTGRNAP